MSVCPHCGGNGYHTWAGSGQCPGIEIERLKSATAWDSYALREQERSQWKALLVRAADALENILPAISGIMKITIVPLIAELRKAAE